MASLTDMRPPKSVRARRKSDGKWLRTLFPMVFTEHKELAIAYRDVIWLYQDAKFSSMTDEEFADIEVCPLERNEHLVVILTTSRPGYDK